MKDQLNDAEVQDGQHESDRHESGQQESFVNEEGDSTEPEMTLEDAKRTIEELTGMKTTLETQYKNLQGTHQRAIEEGKITKGLETTLNSLATQFSTLEENQAALYDRVTRSGASLDDDLDYRDNGKPERQQESAVERLKRDREKRKADTEKAALLQQYENEVDGAAARLLDGLNIPPTDPLLNRAVAARNQGRLSEVIPLLEQAVDGHKTKMAADAAKSLEEEQKKAKKKQVQDSGALEVSISAGTPSKTNSKLKIGDIESIAKTAKTPWDLINATKGKEWE